MTVYPPRKGIPRAPRWTHDEIALLERILDRAADGCETARNHELVDISILTGRTVSAVATMLHKLRDQRRALGVARLSFPHEEMQLL